MRSARRESEKRRIKGEMWEKWGATYGRNGRVGENKYLVLVGVDLGERRWRAQPRRLYRRRRPLGRKRLAVPTPVRGRRKAATRSESAAAAAAAASSQMASGAAQKQAAEAHVPSVLIGNAGQRPSLQRPAPRSARWRQWRQWRQWRLRLWRRTRARRTQRGQRDSR